MITGLTYILTSVVLGLVIILGRRSRHMSVEGTDRFAYPAIYIWIAFGGIIFFLALPFLIYFFATPNRQPVQLLIMLLGSSLFVILFAWSNLYLKKFFVEVDGDKLRIGGLGKTREYLFRDVVRIAIVQGGKGGMEMTLFDRANSVILKASDSIQDFDDLLAIVRQRLPDRGVMYEYRDRWGKWTRKDHR